MTLFEMIFLALKNIFKRQSNRRMMAGIDLANYKI